MTYTPQKLHELVMTHARALGFELAGVSAAAASTRENFIREWIAEGKHGEMSYMEDGLDVRLDIRKKLPWAKSVISVGMGYFGEKQEARSKEEEGVVGKIARYAWGRDYHAVIAPRLKKLERALRESLPADLAGFKARAYCDAGPILEREYAARAGLGWIGKHTLMIHPRHGSYFLLGELVTSLEIASDEPMTDHCGTCTRCIDACPTAAIAPYSVDGSKCISYLTIEHEGEIGESLKKPMAEAGYLIGCDICQDVCPFNRAPLPTQERGFSPRAPAPGVAAEQVVYWNEQDWEMATIGGAHRRVKLPLWKRNAGVLLELPKKGEPSA